MRSCTRVGDAYRELDEVQVGIRSRIERTELGAHVRVTFCRLPCRQSGPLSFLVVVAPCLHVPAHLDEPDHVTQSGSRAPCSTPAARGFDDRLRRKRDPLSVEESLSSNPATDVLHSPDSYTSRKFYRARKRTGPNAAP